jgi:hypothetical protein
LIYDGDIILDHKYAGVVFGDKDQLKVLGYFGAAKSYHKFLICECSICKLDPELFGKGLFKTTYSNIRQGAIPCGCAKQVNYSKEQQLVRVNRACNLSGFSFLGFIGDKITSQTKLRLECKEHGIWETTSIESFVNGGMCMPCVLVRNGKNKRLDDSVVIESILASGNFHPDTVFRRSERKTSQGVSNYWYVDCPDCGTTGEAWIGNLQNGSRPCECSKGRQTEAYINIIYDNDLPIAIKFGISRNSLLRLYFINHNSVYDVSNYAIYNFPNTFSTKAAERECKSSLECGILSKNEVPGGYSETTYVYNLEKVVEIYEKHGGIKSEQLI